MLTHCCKSFSESFPYHGQYPASSLRSERSLQLSRHSLQTAGPRPAPLRRSPGGRADDLPYLPPPAHATLPLSNFISLKGNHELRTPILNLETVIRIHIKSNMLVLKATNSEK